MVQNQSTPGLNRGLSSNFKCVRSASSMKHKRMCDLYEKVGFSQKMFSNELSMNLPLWTRFEKAVHEVETHWLSPVKKKFLAQ